MLGRRITDPLGIEGERREIEGLGLLDVLTRLGPEKALRHVTGCAFGAALDAYEMHMGETTGVATAKPFATLDHGGTDGAVSDDGRVIGTYCHGLLGNGSLRGAVLARIGGSGGAFDHGKVVDAALDDLAEALETHLDFDPLLAVAQGAAR